MAERNEWRKVSLAELTAEAKERVNNADGDGRAVYGIDRNEGLVPQAKYTANNLSRYKLLEPGMFAYNPMRLNIGSIGYCSYRHKPGLVSPDYVVFRCILNVLSPDFFSWVIRGSEWAEWTSQAGVGSVRTRIYFREFSRFVFTCPPIGEQLEIAHLLTSIADRIKLNRCIIETLESMARALFLSWFVDFDPVRAKIEGRQPFGMDAEIAKLFPCGFANSPLGEIPIGWNIVPLDETARFLNGLALQKYPPVGQEYLPVIKIAELRRGVTSASDKANPDIPSDYVVSDGDFLFSWSGSLEAVIWTGGRGALNQHLFKVTSDRFPQWFVYQWVRKHLPEFQQIAASKATTMGHIQRHHLHEALVLVPPPNLLDAMTQVMAPLLDRVVGNLIENQILATMRDTLLPKLMFGQVRVREAEKAVEEVV